MPIITDEIALIVKLEAHLKHIAGLFISDGILHVKKTSTLFKIYDEVKLMLALIEGNKEP